MLLITHDRALLDAVGTPHHRGRGRRAALLPRRLGRSTCACARSACRTSAPPSARSRRSRRRRETAKPRAAAGAPSKNQRRQAERLEKEIEAAEAALKALEEELADPAAWSTPERSAESTARHDAAKRELKELYARWEEALAFTVK